jgi:hypothetical protein
MSRITLDTTYADLRESDLVIDKSGQAWPLGDLDRDEIACTFWLLDPVTKIKMHNMASVLDAAVKVSRLPTQADEAAKLEADFPKSSAPASGEGSEAEFPVSDDPAWIAAVTGLEPTSDEVAALAAGADSFVSMEEAVAAVEEIGGTVEAEVTAAEVDAAAAATEDAPVTLPPFADMTPLEQRSHLYLLHGVYGHDLVSKAELGALHDEAHLTPPQSRYVPHSHE